MDCKLRPNKEYVCCCYKGDDLFYVNGVSDSDKRFVISQSKKLYRLCAPELYATNFSLYASFAGNKNEEDIQV